jgi:hypothetical protein
MTTRNRADLVNKAISVTFSAGKVAGNWYLLMHRRVVHEGVAWNNLVAAFPMNNEEQARGMIADIYGEVDEEDF